MDTEESEISLLDLLVVVAENLKLLVLGPVVVGFLALGLAYVMPKSYTSQAILALPSTSTPAQTAAMMGSPMVLDPVIESLGLSEGRPIEQARAKLSGQIKASFGKDNLLRLEVTAPSPEGAQKIANAVIDAWLATTKPRQEDKLELTRKLKLNQDALEVVSQLIKRLAGETTKLILPGVKFELATPTVQLLQLRNSYVDAIATIETQLRGQTRDVVALPPALPTEPVASRKSRIAILAALAAGFALMLWVFIRQSWRNAAQDPQASKKQARLRSALGLNREP